MEKRYGKDGQLGQALKKFANTELQKQFLASDEGLRLRERAYYGFFEITPYGIPYAVAGLLFLWLAAPGSSLARARSPPPPTTTRAGTPKLAPAASSSAAPARRGS